MNWFRVLVFVSGLLILALPVKAKENRNAFNIRDPQPEVIDPSLQLNYSPPDAPKIPPIKYFEQDPAVSLREKIDRLLQGIKIDVPPEYDHYGYEMRRYMAHVGGPNVYAHPKEIRAQLKNIEKAKIIFKYWRDDLFNEISDIQKEIDRTNAGSDIRTTFKYNAGIVRAFLAECQVWLNKNEEVLKFLQEKEGLYTFEDPRFDFETSQDKYDFADHYIAAIKAREVINSYVSFSMMVY